MIHNKIEKLHNVFFVPNSDGVIPRNSWDALSQIWSSMDTMQAITTYKHGCIDIDGHTKRYWDMGEFYRRTELYAHICENMFIGNSYMKEILGEKFYNEMTALFSMITP